MGGSSPKGRGCESVSRHNVFPPEACLIRFAILSHPTLLVFVLPVYYNQKQLKLNSQPTENMLTSSMQPIPRPSLSFANLPAAAAAAATRPSPPFLFPRKWHFVISFRAASSSSSAAAASPAPGVNLQPLESALAKKDSNAVKETLDQLSEVGWAKRWSSQPYVSRRTTSLRELTSLGIKNAENLAIPSVRNDAAFLFTVVGTTGFLAVLAGQLPGDWGFFLPYLIGSISLVVLAVGSISPGLLHAAISGFSSFFPDYQERISRHEAAHFLIAYLLGLPILDYSLDIGKEHVNLIDKRLEELIYSGQLDAKELDRLAVVAMAGLAAEGLQYDKVIGQSADLFTLQRFINRSKPQLSKDQQQNLTRWAVLFAGSLLKNNKVLHEALMRAMSDKATVLECIDAIEKAG